VFSLEEMLAATKNLRNDKAPGLDVEIQIWWHVVGTAT